MKTIIISAVLILISSPVHAEDFSPDYGICIVRPGEEMRSVWKEFNTAIRSNQWQEALSCCSSNVQKAAKASTNLLQEFFGKSGVVGLSSSNLVSTTQSPDGNRMEYIFKCDTGGLLLIRFVKEDGKWKILLDPKQQQDKIPTKPSSLPRTPIGN
jgi:hypothetical protein